MIALSHMGDRETYNAADMVSRHIRHSCGHCGSCIGNLSKEKVKVQISKTTGRDSYLIVLEAKAEYKE